MTVAELIAAGGQTERFRNEIKLGAAATPLTLEDRRLASFGLSLSAEPLIQAGAAHEDGPPLREAFARIEATGERVWEAELHRINAKMLAKEHQIEEAYTSLQQALAVARQQQANHWGCVPPPISRGCSAKTAAALRRSNCRLPCTADSRNASIPRT